MPDKNPQSNNYNSHLENKSNVRNMLQEQLLQNAHTQIQRGAPILKSSGYNYKVRDQSDKEHPQTLVGRLHQKCIPFLNWCKHFYRRYEDSSRTRRRWIFGTLLFLIFGSLAVGVLWTRGIIVDNTPIGQPKIFDNGDKIHITREEYDPSTQAAMVYITTSGQNGGISSKDLTTSFRFAHSPRTYESLTPTVQLLPIYQNHFVIVLRNLYSGYHGISIQLKDHNDITMNQLQSSIQVGNNGLPKGSVDASNPHMGAYYMPKRATSVLKYSPTELNSNGVKVQNHYLHMIQEHNVQHIILSNSYLNKNKGYVNPHLTGKSILNKVFQDELKHNKDDIQLRNHLITINNHNISRIKGHIRSLYKGSDMSSNNGQIRSASASVVQLRHENKLYQSEISDDTQAINQTKDHWNQLNNGIYNLPAPTTPNNAQSWGDGKGKR